MEKKLELAKLKRYKIQQKKGLNSTMKYFNDEQHLFYLNQFKKDKLEKLLRSLLKKNVDAPIIKFENDSN